MDELRGSEGERCHVIDVNRDKLIVTGTVLAVLEDRGKVRVQYDDGAIMDCSYQLVTLLDDEDTALAKARG